MNNTDHKNQRKKIKMKNIVKRGVATFLAILMAFTVLPESTLFAMAAPYDTGNLNNNIIYDQGITISNANALLSDDASSFNETIAGADDGSDHNEETFSEENEMWQEDADDISGQDIDETENEDIVSENGISVNEAEYGDGVINLPNVSFNFTLMNGNTAVGTYFSLEYAFEAFEKIYSGNYDNPKIIVSSADDEGNATISLVGYSGTDYDNFFPNDFNAQNGCSIEIEDEVKELILSGGDEESVLSIPDFDLFVFDGNQTEVVINNYVDIYSHNSNIFDNENLSKVTNNGHLSIYNCEGKCISFEGENNSVNFSSTGSVYIDTMTIDADSFDDEGKFTISYSKLSIFTIGILNIDTGSNGDPYNLIFDGDAIDIGELNINGNIEIRGANSGCNSITADKVNIGDSASIDINSVDFDALTLDVGTFTAVNAEVAVNNCSQMNIGDLSLDSVIWSGDDNETKTTISGKVDIENSSDVRLFGLLLYNAGDINVINSELYMYFDYDSEFNNLSAEGSDITINGGRIYVYSNDINLKNNSVLTVENIISLNCNNLTVSGTGLDETNGRYLINIFNNATNNYYTFINVNNTYNGGSQGTIYLHDNAGLFVEIAVNVKDVLIDDGNLSIGSGGFNQLSSGSLTFVRQDNAQNINNLIHIDSVPTNVKVNFYNIIGLNREGTSGGQVATIELRKTDPAKSFVINGNPTLADDNDYINVINNGNAFAPGSVLFTTDMASGFDTWTIKSEGLDALQNGKNIIASNNIVQVYTQEGYIREITEGTLDGANSLGSFFTIKDASTFIDSLNMSSVDYVIVVNSDLDCGGSLVLPSKCLSATITSGKYTDEGYIQQVSLYNTGDITLKTNTSLYLIDLHINSGSIDSTTYKTLKTSGKNCTFLNCTVDALTVNTSSEENITYDYSSMHLHSSLNSTKAAWSFLGLNDCSLTVEGSIVLYDIYLYVEEDCKVLDITYGKSAADKFTILNSVSSLNDDSMGYLVTNGDDETWGTLYSYYSESQYDDPTTDIVYPIHNSFINVIKYADGELVKYNPGDTFVESAKYVTPDWFAYEFEDNLYIPAVKVGDKIVLQSNTSGLYVSLYEGQMVPYEEDDELSNGNRNIGDNTYHIESNIGRYATLQEAYNAIDALNNPDAAYIVQINGNIIHDTDLYATVLPADKTLTLPSKAVWVYTVLDNDENQNLPLNFKGNSLTLKTNMYFDKVALTKEATGNGNSAVTVNIGSYSLEMDNSYKYDCDYLPVNFSGAGIGSSSFLSFNSTRRESEDDNSYDVYYILSIRNIDTVFDSVGITVNGETNVSVFVFISSEDANKEYFCGKFTADRYEVTNHWISDSSDVDLYFCKSEDAAASAPAPVVTIGDIFVGDFVQLTMHVPVKCTMQGDMVKSYTPNTTVEGVIVITPDISQMTVKAYDVSYTKNLSEGELNVNTELDFIPVIRAECTELGTNIIASIETSDSTSKFCSSDVVTTSLQSGCLGCYIGDRNVSLYDSDIVHPDYFIGYYASFQDAVNEINTINYKTDYCIQINNPFALEEAANITMPKASCVNKLFIIGQHDPSEDTEDTYQYQNTLPTALTYKGNITLTSDTVIKNIDFVQVNNSFEAVNKYQSGINKGIAPMVLNAGNYRLTFEDFCTFNTPLDLKGSAKGFLEFADNAGVSTVNGTNSDPSASDYSDVCNQIAPGFVYIAGNITGFGTVDISHVNEMCIRNYYPASADTSKSEPTVTVANFAPSTLFVIRNEDIHISLVCEGKISIKDLVADASGSNFDPVEIFAAKDFTVTNITANNCSLNLNTVLKDPTKPASTVPYLKISGNVDVSEPITVGVYYTLPNGNRYGYLPGEGNNNVLLEAPKADISDFVVDEYCVNNYEFLDLSDPEFDPESDILTIAERDTYYLKKDGNNIRVLDGEDLLLAVFKDNGGSYEYIGSYLNFKDASAAVDALNAPTQAYTFRLLRSNIEKNAEAKSVLHNGDAAYASVTFPSKAGSIKVVSDEMTDLAFNAALSLKSDTTFMNINLLPVTLVTEGGVKNCLKGSQQNINAGKYALSFIGCDTGGLDNVSYTDADKSGIKDISSSKGTLLVDGLNVTVYGNVTNFAEINVKRTSYYTNFIIKGNCTADSISSVDDSTDIVIYGNCTAKDITVDNGDMTVGKICTVNNLYMTDSHVYAYGKLDIKEQINGKGAHAYLDAYDAVNIKNISVESLETIIYFTRDASNKTNLNITGDVNIANTASLYFNMKTNDGGSLQNIDNPETYALTMNYNYAGQVATGDTLKFIMSTKPIVSDNVYMIFGYEGAPVECVRSKGAYYYCPEESKINSVELEVNRSDGTSSNSGTVDYLDINSAIYDINMLKDSEAVYKIKLPAGNDYDVDLTDTKFYSNMTALNKGMYSELTIEELTIEGAEEGTGIKMANSAYTFYGDVTLEGIALDVSASSYSINIGNNGNSTPDATFEVVNFGNNLSKIAGSGCTPNIAINSCSKLDMSIGFSSVNSVRLSDVKLITRGSSTINSQLALGLCSSYEAYGASKVGYVFAYGVSMHDIEEVPYIATMLDNADISRAKPRLEITGCNPNQYANPIMVKLYEYNKDAAKSTATMTLLEDEKYDGAKLVLAKKESAGFFMAYPYCTVNNSSYKLEYAADYANYSAYKDASGYVYNGDVSEKEIVIHTYTGDFDYINNQGSFFSYADNYADAVKIIDSANNPNAKYEIVLLNDGEAYYTTANNTLGAMTFPSKAAEITICGDYDPSEVNPETIDSVRPQLVFTGSPSAKTDVLFDQVKLTNPKNTNGEIDGISTANGKTITFDNAVAGNTEQAVLFKSFNNTNVNFELYGVTEFGATSGNLNIGDLTVHGNGFVSAGEGYSISVKNIYGFGGPNLGFYVYSNKNSTPKSQTFQGTINGRLEGVNLMIVPWVYTTEKTYEKLSSFDGRMITTGDMTYASYKKFVTAPVADIECMSVVAFTDTFSGETPDTDNATYDGDAYRIVKNNNGIYVADVESLGEPGYTVSVLDENHEPVTLGNYYEWAQAVKEIDSRNDMTATYGIEVNSDNTEVIPNLTMPSKAARVNIFNNDGYDTALLTKSSTITLKSNVSIEVVPISLKNVNDLSSSQLCTIAAGNYTLTFEGLYDYGYFYIGNNNKIAVNNAGYNFTGSANGTIQIPMAYDVAGSYISSDVINKVTGVGNFVMNNEMGNGYSFSFDIPGGISNVGKLCIGKNITIDTKSNDISVKNLVTNGADEIHTRNLTVSDTYELRSEVDYDNFRSAAIYAGTLDKGTGKINIKNICSYITVATLSGKYSTVDLYGKMDANGKSLISITGTLGVNSTINEIKDIIDVGLYYSYSWYNRGHGKMAVPSSDQMLLTGKYIHSSAVNYINQTLANEECIYKSGDAIYCTNDSFSENLETTLAHGDGYSMMKFEDAVKEIDKINDTTADYTIVLNNDVFIDNGTAYQALNLPSKASDVTIATNEALRDPESDKYIDDNYLCCLTFTGNITLKSNLSLENIDLCPVKANGDWEEVVTNLSLGKYTLNMTNVDVDCENFDYLLYEWANANNITSCIGNITGSTGSVLICNDTMLAADNITGLTGIVIGGHEITDVNDNTLHVNGLVVRKNLSCQLIRNNISGKYYKSNSYESNDEQALMCIAIGGNMTVGMIDMNLPTVKNLTITKCRVCCHMHVGENSVININGLQDTISGNTFGIEGGIPVAEDASGKLAPVEGGNTEVCLQISAPYDRSFDLPLFNIKAPINADSVYMQYNKMGDSHVYSVVINNSTAYIGHAM